MATRLKLRLPCRPAKLTTAETFSQSMMKFAIPCPTALWEVEFHNNVNDLVTKLDLLNTLHDSDAILGSFL